MFRIAIPTYDRYNEFKTLNYLKYNNVPDEMIDIFVASEEQLELYKNCISGNYNFIIGVLGLVPQRNFISNYYDEGQIYISIDDDIEDLIHKDDKLFLEWTQECIEYIKNNNIGILGINPSVNPFFFEQRKNTTSFKKGKYLIIGCFQILINHKDLQLSLISMEDWERSVLYDIKYGATARYNDILIKTKYFHKRGGLSSQRTRENYLNSLNIMIYKYPDRLKYNYKKLPLDKYNEMPNIQFRRSIIIPEKAIILPKINASELVELYNMLDNLYIAKKTKNTNRRGFPMGHRATTFGFTRGRFHGRYELGMMSKKYPEVYDELLRIGNIYCPFEFTSIHVNKNVVCPHHKDSQNTGKSMLISFGDYNGCNIVIEGQEYDANCQPVIFDGSVLEHWNTDFIGDENNKYSLVYFNNSKQSNRKK